MRRLRSLLAVALSALAADEVNAQASAPAAAADTVCARPDFRRFDFWVGEWVVRDTAGNVIGRNQVTRDVGGCGLHEHWTAARNNEIGESFTAWAPGEGKWHQLYVGSGGYIVVMSGGFEGDRLVMFTAPRPSARDPKVQAVERWSWTPIDASHVRQHAEVSTDGGKVWRTTFDGRYERATR